MLFILFFRNKIFVNFIFLYLDFMEKDGEGGHLPNPRHVPLPKGLKTRQKDPQVKLLHNR